VGRGYRDVPPQGWGLVTDHPRQEPFDDFTGFWDPCRTRPPPATPRPP